MPRRRGAHGKERASRRTPDLDAIRAILATARGEGRTTLLEPEGLAILAAAGIAVPRWQTVADARAIGSGPLRSTPLADLFGDRVVIKVVSSEIVHKTEVGGVAIVRRDGAAVTEAIEAMTGRLRRGSRSARAAEAIAGYLIAEHVEHDATVGGELLLSLRWTDDFGPVVSVGAGGIHTEALAGDLRPGREIAIVSPTLTPRSRIGEVLQATTAVRLATTAQRGRKPRVHLDRLVDVVGRLLALGKALVPGELRELEINPAAVTRDGLVALDVLATLGDGPAVSAAAVPATSAMVIAPSAAALAAPAVTAASPAVTAASPAAAPAALRRPTRKLGRLLKPRSAAIIGVSSTMNPGRVILNNLIREGFGQRRITVVKPGRAEIDGVRCVPDIASLPGKVDLFVVAVSAEQAPDIVAEVIERDLAETLIVIPAGLEETAGGVERAARMRAALATARSSKGGGPLINGGNCLGIRSRPGHYDTLFIPAWKLPGGGVPAPIALITGSGAFAVTRLSRLGRLEPRYVVTVGNQMDLTVGDYLAHLKNDRAVRVFGVYLEGFAPLDGARFMAAAAEITAQGRAIVLYRAGRTSAGAVASASHTAAIAGDAIVTRELARQAGVLWAETPDDFDELVRTFAMLEETEARGRRLGAVSNAGSECVTIADHLGSLTLAPFSRRTGARLTEILAPAGIDAVVDVHNPLDLTPIADAEVYERVVRTVLGATEVDVGIVGIVPLTDSLETLAAGPGHAENVLGRDAIAARMARLWRESDKPWVAVVDAGALYTPFVELLEAAGIPVFGTADAAMRALAAFCDVSLGRARG